MVLRIRRRKPVVLAAIGYLASAVGWRMWVAGKRRRRLARVRRA
ncbi:MAG: hypothetical protein ACK46X_19655 [Candidatus Sericytochromatia bacterium]